MKQSKTIIFLLVIISISLGQKTVLNNSINTTYVPQGSILTALNGYGYTFATISSLSNLGSSNPALLSSIEDISIEISYQKDQRINEAWLTLFDYERIDKYPQSFSIVNPLNRYVIAYSFNQYFNSRLIYPSLEITTVEDPDGTGEVFDIEEETLLSSQSLAISTFLSKNLSIGFRYNYYRLNMYHRIWKYELEDVTYNHGFSIGLTYDGSLYRIGLQFDNSARLNDSFTIINSTIIVNPDALTEKDTLTYKSRIKYHGYLPAKIGAGLSLRLIPRVQLIGNFKYIYWNDIEDQFVNELEYSGNVIFNLNSIIDVSCGLVKTRGPFDDIRTNELYGFQEKYEATYLFIGFKLSMKRIEIDYNFADSRHYSDTTRQNTINKIGFGVKL